MIWSMAPEIWVRPLPAPPLLLQASPWAMKFAGMDQIITLEQATSLAKTGKL